MQARGIAMIDAIQGPPRWDGPDVLLRQTSFRALAEPRAFRDAGRLGRRRLAAGALRRGRGARHRAHPRRPRPLRRDAAPRSTPAWPPTARHGGARRCAAGGRRRGVGRPAARHRARPAARRARRTSPSSSRGRPVCAVTRSSRRRLRDAAGARRDRAAADRRPRRRRRPAPPPRSSTRTSCPRSAAGIFQSNLTGDGRRTPQWPARAATPAGWPASSRPRWPTRSRSTPRSSRPRSRAQPRTRRRADCTPRKLRSVGSRWCRLGDAARRPHQRQSLTAAASMSSSPSSTRLAASPSGTKLSRLATRADPSAEAVLDAARSSTPSPTPPLCRVSSTISTRRCAAASRRMSSTGSGRASAGRAPARSMPCRGQAPARRAGSSARRCRT